MTVESDESPHPQGRPPSVPVDTPLAKPVQDLLARLELGSLSDSEVFSYPGRNDNWAGVTDTGEPVFVKRLKGFPGETLKRYRRLMTFEEVARRANTEIARPAFLGGDDEERILVYEMLSGTRSGSELAAADEFTAELSERAGRTLAELHRLPVRPQDFPESDPHPYPPVEDLRALPLPLYVGATAAFVQAWGLLQRDPGLLAALERMRAAEVRAPRAPVHGDLRLDQYLIEEPATAQGRSDSAGRGRLLVNDWEEFRLGDPARDVGAYVGEWLHRAVLRIPSQEKDDGFAQPLTHREVVERGDAELRRARPLVRAFVAGYRAAGGPWDEDTPVRATGYAGWHLIDRLIASTRENGRLSAIVRAAAGIGRTALLDPRDSVSAVGLGEAA
ncbi:class V lanthionine synthetase subunit LxmK [Streptomyces sp. JNUCC 64]